MLNLMETHGLVLCSAGTGSWVLDGWLCSVIHIEYCMVQSDLLCGLQGRLIECMINR